MTNNQNGFDNNFEPSENNPNGSNVNNNFNNSSQNNVNQSMSGNTNNVFQNQQPPFSYSWDGSVYNGTGSKKPHKGRGLKAFAATVTVCLILVLAMVGWAVYMDYYPADTGSEASATESKSDSKSTVSVPEVIKVNDTTVEYKNQLTEVYDKVKDSCVSVITNQALGSGFVVKEDGYIITNHHVIADAKSINVQFYNGDKYKAELIGSDSISDIAVLKIEGTFKPIALGNSDA
jgi:serine protease Do